MLTFIASVAGESVAGILKSPPEVGVEQTIITLVQWLKISIESTSALIIGIGMVVALFEFSRAIIGRETRNFISIRLTLARYLALALEFQLGADILSTAISPSWDQIGKLGAIAIIRTALNYFLTREMKEERKVGGRAVQPDEPVGHDDDPGSEASPKP